MQIINTDWIITTDADCVVNKNWLLTLDNYIQLHDVAMIADGNVYLWQFILHHFQQLDIASLQGATIGVLVLIKDLCAMAPTLRIPNPFPGN
jgi:hypothetical protein